MTDNMQKWSKDMNWSFQIGIKLMKRCSAFVVIMNIVNILTVKVIMNTETMIQTRMPKIFKVENYQLW